MNATQRIESARNLYFGGDLVGARRACEVVLLAPIDAQEATDARLILVECARRSGDTQAGVAHAKAAVASTPHHALAHYALAVCEDESGDKAAAIEHLHRAIEHDATMAQSHRFLGVLLIDVGQPLSAISSLERAIGLEPENADGWNNMGTALHHANRLDDAEAAYRRALAIKPDFPRAECNLAVVQRDKGRPDLAETTLRECIARRPPDTAYRPAYTALADLLRSRSELDEAARLYLAAAKLAPDSSSGEMLDLGLVLTERGDPAQAKKAFAHALRMNPKSLRAAMAMNLTLPMIYADAADVARSRAQYAQGLETLERELDSMISGLSSQKIANALMWSNFFLAYQGEDDRELQARYAALVARALDQADPAWRAPLAPHPVAGRKIRVGFISALLRQGTVGQYFTRWLTDLDRERFEVCFYPLGNNVDAVTSAIKDRADRVRAFVGGDAFPSAIVPVIRDEHLDVLVYPELGMDQVTFALAAMRLAPRQYAGWGHPVTSGHTTIDAFFSCDAMEPPEGQQHYTERLVRLPGIGTRFARPVLPARAEREAYSLPREATLLLCPQSLFKIHPDNDTIFARVLASNPSAVLVLFAGRHPAITDQFMRRLQRCFDGYGIAIRERTRVLPQLDHEGYLSINLACDAMLDTLHWSGGQTSVDALDCGLPVVTLPGALMRGRQSYGMLKLIGVEELIATDVEDYLRIANRLCGDPAWRASLSQRIRERCGRLFDDAEPIAALEAFYRDATSAA
ncbi:MAG TPA: tetratricopeptide repeat protein [Casimicrobiaceae bacterium]|nr:tetratricopeptide repeat protein [Casimicrobiaceae bacterium]